jgi:murein L,D-transpeptidase YcbB/YkuD
MRGHFPVAAILFTAQALALAVGGSARAEDAVAPESVPAVTQSTPAAPPADLPSTPPAPAVQPAPVRSTAPAAEPSNSQPSSTAEQALPVDAVVAAIRTKLADPLLRKDANPDDLTALEAFYGTRTSGPLWMTEMGFSARGQAALFEIGKADDWGLSAAAFELPPAGELPASPEAQAAAEIKLDLAILKYARFARGGRLNPPQLSDLFDQAPPLRDPKAVLPEIATASAPDAYLQSLHPKHEQFGRLRQALLKAQDKTGGKAAASERDIQRLIINMERWRWMPEDLGAFYVWNNTPEFMLYVVKDGKAIFADKTLVGTSAYATPVFTADMKTIVFNPEWTVPETIVKENLLPNLRHGGWFGGSASILDEHGLQVNYNGRVVDPGSIDWNNVNMAKVSFTQAPGPANVLGKLKVLFPNKHVVYMHDTIKRELFNQSMRAEGHNCIRVAKPEELASLLLAEDKGWSPTQVQDLVDKGNNAPVTLDHPVPVHMTYFTATVDEKGTVTTFADIYGLDKRVGTALLGKSVSLPAPTANTDERVNGAQAVAPAAVPLKRTVAGNDIAGSLGFSGD